LLYKHGEDLRIIDTVRSIVPHVVGLAWDGVSMWVVGDGNPMKVARLTVGDGGPVWSGPVDLKNLLPEKVALAGFAVGFNRLWAVSGGDPKMVSISYPSFEGQMKVSTNASKEHPRGR
jgi:hypothetical protein